MKIAIIGDGTVGIALAKAIGITSLGPSQEPVNAEVIILCVPTETIKGRQDLSQVYQAFSRIKEAKLIILRSTVLPGTTEKLQSKTKIPVMFVPEFGFEATMEADLASPSHYLFGVTPLSFAKLDLARKVLPEAHQERVMKAISAEFAKYFCNLWGSSQIMLANSLYDWVLDKTGDADIYEEAIRGAVLHRNMPSWGYRIWNQGYRGFGGKCLVKDTSAAIQQYPHPLWKLWEKLNKRLRKQKY